MTKAELVMLVYKALPYSEQIQELDLDAEPQAIRFRWRSDKFRVSMSLGVETVGDGVLSGDNLSIMLEALIRRTFAQIA